MEIDLLEILLLLGGGLVAGVINVMAGGAGFLTFPLLVAAGMSEIEANASNFVAILPANVVGTFVYGRELLHVRKHLGVRLALAAIGGIAGSLLLVLSGPASFQRAVPWLLLFATLTLALGPWLKRKLETDFAFDGTRLPWLSFLLEFLVYVYGGYFGLGMSIALFAIYSIFSRMNVHQANAIRNITIMVMTLISIAIYAHAGFIRWLPSLVMMAGSIAGGYGMATFARRMPAQAVRRGLLAWAVVLTGFAFWKYL